MPVGSAAVVIIGDEILTGKFADENGGWLIRRLRGLGVDLVRLAVVRDVVEEIAAEVARCAAAAELVITTGGIGPTHDDRTYEAVAAAFGLGLEERAELVALMAEFGVPRDPMTTRMVTVPAGAELLGLGKGKYPAVRVQNVVVLPGVPRIMQRMFPLVEPLLQGAPVHAGRVYADDVEHDVAEHLDTVARRFPTVNIGSYPRHGEATGRLIVTVEGRMRGDVEAALDAVASGLMVRAVEGPS